MDYSADVESSISGSVVYSVCNVKQFPLEERVANYEYCIATGHEYRGTTFESLNHIIAVFFESRVVSLMP